MAEPTVVEQSRAIPVELRHAFEGTLPVPLTSIFCRRFALLPPISAVREQRGVWGEAGQTRVVVTSDGGTMREQLVTVDPPHSFSYRLSEITGPMRPLVDSIDGTWEFEPKGTGTLVTWRWRLRPTRIGVYAMPPVTAMWRTYAARALERLSDLLLSPDPGGPAAG